MMLVFVEMCWKQDDYTWIQLKVLWYVHTKFYIYIQGWIHIYVVYKTLILYHLFQVSTWPTLHFYYPFNITQTYIRWIYTDTFAPNFLTFSQSRQVFMWNKWDVRSLIQFIFPTKWGKRIHNNLLQHGIKKKKKTHIILNIFRSLTLLDIPFFSCLISTWCLVKIKERVYSQR